jgi:hypothetical protein
MGGQIFQAQWRFNAMYVQAILLNPCRCVRVPITRKPQTQALYLTYSETPSLIHRIVVLFDAAVALARRPVLSKTNSIQFTSHN